MVVRTSGNTLHNWQILRKTVSGITFSHSFGLMSLDENVGSMKVSVSEEAPCTIDNPITAASIVEVIGAEAFKQAIENIWNPRYYRKRNGSADSIIELLLMGFIWERTEQGLMYWSSVLNKLILNAHLLKRAT